MLHASSRRKQRLSESQWITILEQSGLLCPRTGGVGAAFAGNP